jgi:hypothetical protein
MNRIAFGWIALSSALIAPVTGFAQIGCTRSGLQAATDLYIQAQGKAIPPACPWRRGLPISKTCRSSISSRASSRNR